MAVLLGLLRAGTLRREPVAVLPAVTGRWLAGNSPASRVPSHGVQAYGRHTRSTSSTTRRPRAVRVWAWGRWPAARRSSRASGSSVEPHLHFQLMDHPSVLLAAGTPFCFQPAGGGTDGVPRNGHHLVASETLVPVGQPSGADAGLQRLPR